MQAASPNAARVASPASTPSTTTTAVHGDDQTAATTVAPTPVAHAAPVPSPMHTTTSPSSSPPCVPYHMQRTGSAELVARASPSGYSDAKRGPRAQPYHVPSRAVHAGLLVHRTTSPAMGGHQGAAAGVHEHDRARRRSWPQIQQAAQQVPQQQRPGCGDDQQRIAQLVRLLPVVPSPTNTDAQRTPTVPATIVPANLRFYPLVRAPAMPQAQPQQLQSGSFDDIMSLTGAPFSSASTRVTAANSADDLSTVASLEGSPIGSRAPLVARGCKGCVSPTGSVQTITSCDMYAPAGVASFPATGRRGSALKSAVLDLLADMDEDTLLSIFCVATASAAAAPLPGAQGGAISGGNLFSSPIVDFTELSEIMRGLQTMA